MMPDPIEAAREALLLAAAASPQPWSSDDGNIFSVPLSEKRADTILRRLEGEALPHPDRDLDEPLGFVATCPQTCPNFEADEAFIRHAGTHYADVARALLASSQRIAELEAALRRITEIQHDPHDRVHTCFEARAIATSALRRTLTRDT